MATYSLFAAYAAPRSAPDPLHYSDASAPRTGGGSRNGWFQQKCRLLLDCMPDHEALRFLSAQAYGSSQQESSGGVSYFTLLDGDRLTNVLVRLESLLASCRSDVATLPVKLQLEGIYGGGWSEEDVREAVAGALAGSELPEHVSDDGEDDSPKFLFAALAALLTLFRLAAERDLIVVFYTWMPT